MEQLVLRLGSTGAVALGTREALESYLQSRLQEPVRVEVTDNRRVMVSSRRRPFGVEVRLHRMFLTAPSSVLDALARFLRRRDRADGEVLGRFVRSQRPKPEPSIRKVRLHARGRVHDLVDILDEVKSAHFPEPVQGVRIGWGRNPGAGGRRRSIRLGTYTHDQALVRVHPALDQGFVPRFFVAFVVFHEVLHHVLPPKRDGRITRYHTTAFREREARHPDFARAHAWEREHLDRLLRFVP